MAQRDGDSERFVFDISFNEASTAARAWKDGDNASDWFHEPAGFHAMTQILANFIHKRLHVLLGQKNFDYERGWRRHFHFIVQPIFGQGAFGIEGEIGDCAPSI